VRSPARLVWSSFLLAGLIAGLLGFTTANTYPSTADIAMIVIALLALVLDQIWSRARRDRSSAQA
jgi:uncharacterized membrane protein YtjA (UPF0391 family)